MFINDKEKMEDFVILSKEDFLKSYSYLSESDYDSTMQQLILLNAAIQNFTECSLKSECELGSAITNFVDFVYKDESQDKKNKLSMKLSDKFKKIKEKCKSNKEKWFTEPKL